ncbi:MAG: hypothetical protein AAGG68_31420 [Bacteroidota bacterium]
MKQKLAIWLSLLDRNDVVFDDFFQKPSKTTSFLSEGTLENKMKNEVFHFVFKKECQVSR